MAEMTGLAEFSPAKLEAWAVEARSRTLGLVSDLSDEQFLQVPLLRIINPFLWEIGHVAYFQEYWVLRHANGEPPMLPDSGVGGRKQAACWRSNSSFNSHQRRCGSRDHNKTQNPPWSPFGPVRHS